MLNMNAISRLNPIRDPSRDILIRSSFDFRRSMSRSMTVALRPAILAALIGQNGFGGSIVWLQNRLILAKLRCRM